MRKIAIILCIFLAIALVAGCASSGGGDKAAGGDDTSFEGYDYDSDGKISRDEYHRSFDSLDKNGDGSLDRDEFGGGPRGGGGGHGR